MASRYRLAVFNTHPIQYFAPLYRRLAAQDDIDLTVFYGSRQGVEAGRIDEGFGAEVVWDVPLLDGYEHEFLRNWRADRTVNGFFAQVIPSIVARIARGKFDALIVHGHNSITNLMAVAAAKACGTRVLMRGETHLGLHRSGLKARIRGPVMSAFYSLCDGFLFIGSMNRAFYEAHGVREARLFFVPYTVDNNRFAAEAERLRGDRAAIRRDLGLRRDSVVVLFASKLIDRKRPGDLLEAFAAARKISANIELLFVGSGVLEEELRTRVGELGIADVHFAGFVNQANLPKYFAVADVFVLPSENEPWGLIVNEAMCGRLPIVTTSDVGAAADLVHDGETGFVYRPGDTKSLSEILSRIAQDAGLRARLAEGAASRISHWSYSECVEGIRAALRAGGPPRCGRQS